MLSLSFFIILYKRSQEPLFYHYLKYENVSRMVEENKLNWIKHKADSQTPV